MWRSRGNLCFVHSWFRGRGAARLSFPVAKARSTTRTAKRSAPSGVVAPLQKCQSQADLQGTFLAHMERFACRLAALEVSGAAPIPILCSSGPAMLGMHAASRKSGAQHCTNLVPC